MKAYTYILKCSDGSLYTGSTKNLEFKLAQHLNGEGSNYTRKKLPVKLVYFEEYDRIDSAFIREKQIQGWSRAKKLALINNKINFLNDLAKCKNKSYCGNIEADAKDGFGSAQPPMKRTRSLSGAEGNRNEGQ